MPDPFKPPHDTPTMVLHGEIQDLRQQINTMSHLMVRLLKVALLSRIRPLGGDMLQNRSLDDLADASAVLQSELDEIAGHFMAMRMGAAARGKNVEDIDLVLYLYGIEGVSPHQQGMER